MIDLDAIAAKIRELAAEFPDRRAECFYLNPDFTPNCIVGHALLATGMTIGRLEKHEGRAFDTILAMENRSSRYSRTAKWIQEVQLRQDNGATWSESVNGADRDLRVAP